MFRKIIINASSNLKRGLDLGTKIKSNGWLDIGTEGVKGVPNVHKHEHDQQELSRHWKHKAMAP
jgi:hypothetical protein